jgi:hypothetical protein
MSMRIIEAYPVPPAPKTQPAMRADRRRSADSMQILGGPEDVAPTDPVFVLRRATTYRASSGRHRGSAPLDEIGLRKLQRESVSSMGSIAERPIGSVAEGARQLSKQELIAAQREASRANQRAMISAQANSVRGVDVLLPGNAVLRSARAGSDDGVRYSYLQPDGEALDVSDIVEDVLGGGGGDLLRGQLDGARLDVVLGRIRDKDAAGAGQATLDAIAGFYSGDDDDNNDDDESDDDADRSGAMTPPAAVLNARNAHQRSGSLTGAVRALSPGSGSRTTTPIAWATRPAEPSRAQSSASAFSDETYRTAVGSPMHSTLTLARQTSTPKPYSRARPALPKDDFGVSHMMAIVELAGLRGRAPPLPKLDAVDELLFGRAFDVESLHPLVREIYAPSFRQLDDMDRVRLFSMFARAVLTARLQALDDLLQMSTSTAVKK